MTGSAWLVNVLAFVGRDILHSANGGCSREELTITPVQPKPAFLAVSREKPRAHLSAQEYSHEIDPNRLVGREAPGERANAH